MSFGKTAVPASGFGAPTAPAPGGFGKAPAAAGGFGAPAAGGFGSAATAPAAGGFGKAPAAGGFGAAPAAGGFGSAAPPAAGGFGKAPAASGFGAPAASGFGAPAAGGFGAPAAGGFGAPAAGGFGAPAAGGFGKAPVAPGPQLAYTGITGPGYTAPNAPSWITGTDLSQVTDDTLVSKLPQNLRQHLGQLLEFGEKERNARNEINHMYQQLLADSNPTGLRALQQRLESLTSSSSRGVDQLVVDVYHRDKTVKQLLQRSRDAEDSVTTYTRDVWDRIHREGAEYWQQKLNSREGPSTLLRNMMTNTEQVMAEVDHAISDLAAALAPLRRQAGGASMSPNPQQAASSSSGGQAQYMSSAIASYRGAPPGADGNTALLAYGASSTAGGAGAFDFPTATPLDATQVVQGSLQQSMAAFIALGETISSLHSRTNQVRDHVARYYGEAEAEELFLQVPDSDEAAVDAEANAFVTLTIGDTMKGRMHQVSAASRGARGNAAASFLPGITVPRHTMRYDPQLEQAGNVAPASGAAAPAVAAGGFGSAPGAVPTTGGFGAAPAAGTGFGTQPSAAAAPPATGGFGAKAPPTTGGFGAPAPATTVGFAAGTATTPGGPAAPLSNPQGFGATPAPSGGFGAATPGTGATPSMITPSLPGMSPSPAGPVAFGSSPSPTAAASPDDGRPANRPRKR